MGVWGSCCGRHPRDLQNIFSDRPRSVMEVRRNKYSCTSADNSEKEEYPKRSLIEKPQISLFKNLYGKEEYPQIRLIETPKMSVFNNTCVSNVDKDGELVYRPSKKIDLERMDSQFICLEDSMVEASESICSMKG